ncbi:MAG: hypothetical protein HQL15_09140 [Candidatus Omnitrophica bacterium]|nr:hypothetical protein [Candidatus Omnitrophota bacterium]
MKACLGHGQWMVRWVPDLYFGYGYPVFNFYPPVFYMLGALIADLGIGIVMAFNVSMFIVFFLSGCTMYLFARELWGREGGLISAMAYMFAPYHIVDLYVRTTAAETTSFIFLPLILWSFYKLQQTSRKRYVVFSSLSCAGLLLTHNITSIIFFPLAFVYIGLLYWPYSSYVRIMSLLRGFLALAVGTGLAAFFWLPAFVEKKFVHIDVLTKGSEDFHKNFLSLKQLVSPVWGYNLPHDVEPTMSCQVGLVHILMVLIVLMGIKKLAGQGAQLMAQGVFFMMVLAGAIFLTLPCSLVIWQHISLLQFLQFPFRFLILVVLAVSVIAGGIVVLAGPRNLFIISMAAGLMIFLANFSYCHPRATFNYDLSVTNTDPERILSNLVPQDGGDYIPIWVKNGLKGLPSSKPAQKLQALTDGQVLDSNKISPLRYRFKVRSQQLSIFCFHSFYFPGWMVDVDGRGTNILKDNPLGLIIFQCPEGVHDVDIYFGTTPLRRTALEITVGSLVLLVLMLIFPVSGI